MTAIAGTALVRTAGLAAVLAACAVIAPSASARTNVDPCGGPAPHLTADGLHCGGVFEIAAGATRTVPREDAAPRCDSAKGMIVSIAANASGGYEYALGDDRRGEQDQVEIGVEAIGGAWDYWAEGGDVQWDDNSTATSGRRHQPIDVDPSFHNWGSARSRVRLFFRCTTIP